MPWSPRGKETDSEAGGPRRQGVRRPSSPPASGLSLLDETAEMKRERGGEQGRADVRSLGRNSLDRLGPTPRQGQRLRLPHPRLSPAFFGPLRTRAMGHSAAVPRRSSRASIAGRVLCSVVARPRAVGMAEIERRAGEDELAAAGATHLPAGDEGSEPLPQGSVCAAVAACLRGSTAAGTLDLLGLTASARPACRDDLAVPADTGERAHSA